MQLQVNIDFLLLTEFVDKVKDPFNSKFVFVDDLSQVDISKNRDNDMTVKSICNSSVSGNAV